MPKGKSAQPQTTNLTLVSVDSNYWINAIKVVREVAAKYGMMSLEQGFGLKEAKELVDEVRHEGKKRTLLRNVSIADARAAKRMFARVGTKVRLGKFDSAEVVNA